jgi:hypothetical protein
MDIVKVIWQLSSFSSGGRAVPFRALFQTQASTQVETLTYKASLKASSHKQ